MSVEVESSSFRDPSGVVFRLDGVLYRQVNRIYQKQFDALVSTSFYDKLMNTGMLINHQRVEGIDPVCSDAYCILRPQKVPFISYPYEWTFAQLKDAALLTLRLHRLALENGFMLKDASAYNIQFLNGQPVLIDTLSFDFYQENKPWIAYGQFCRHFLAPLLLMRHVDIRLISLLRLYIDGVPLDMVMRLLKGKGGLFAKQHIAWHAKATLKHAQDGKGDVAGYTLRLPKSHQIALIESMIRGVEALALKNMQTEWGDYYAHTNYSAQGAQDKHALVKAYLAEIVPKTLWDLGANDGTYSRLGLEIGASVVALDIDPTAVMRNYNAVKKHKLDMLPLVFDLTNPSPSIGFANSERLCLSARQHPDCVLALAVIHHLAISNNLPLPKIAAWLASFTNDLIIEFVPKSDSQVQILLATRDDIFTQYTQEDFERAFCEPFKLVKRETIAQSNRVLYWFHIK
ncbi:MAG: hypothetical protein VB099_15465 [Candidatus Limiplasma sp.]|nr:hypothetical protein [Candidatus Limiplasma sp.]